MSDASTKTMIDMYMEEATAPMFLAGFFQSPAKNFHNTEKVEIDVLRDDESVAVVIQDLAAGPRANESTLYVNKGFTPPIYDEKGAITAYELIKRQPGVNPFEDPSFGANAASQSFRIFRKLEAKIRRAVELMASQVLQTGELTLKDQNGASVYALDFEPKASHFPVFGTPWAVDGATGNPLSDLETLATTVRRDGKKNPNKLIFGAGAMQRFLANAKVQARLDNRNMSLGQVAPESRGGGATFMGWVWIGHYRMEMWMYDGFYKDVQTGADTPYVADLGVIMLSEGARLDLTYGSIPMFIAPEARALPFLPPRITSSAAGIAMTTNSWLTEDGKSLMVSAGTRPLTIPTAIDTFGAGMVG